MRDRPDRHEQSLIPEVARLDIPLRSVVNLRRVAGELRGLAERLDFLSRDTGPTWEVLYDARKACGRTRRNLERIRTPGRPRTRKESLRWVR